jgi:predicted transcriptional regulator
MKKIIINKGNILKYDFRLNYKCSTVLGAINHIIQNKSGSAFDSFTDENGVWYAVSYNEIMKEVPILKISKTTCMLYVNYLIDMGFIERHWNCERLSKTYLKPSYNFRLYFEYDKSEIVINQNDCFSFDRKPTLLNWIVLKEIEKNAIGKFNYNYVLIDEKVLLNSLLGLFKSRATYIKNLNDLLKMGYIEKTEKPRLDKEYFYRAGAKFLGFKELIK